MEEGEINIIRVYRQLLNILYFREYPAGSSGIIIGLIQLGSALISESPSMLFLVSIISLPSSEEWRKERGHSRVPNGIGHFLFRICWLNNANKI